MENFIILLSPIVAALLAQVAKFIIFSLKHGFNWRFLFEYGHMPSSHTAMMTALASSIAFYEGIQSSGFAVATIMTLLIVSDAMRLRMYIGSYGKTLNNLIDQLSLEDEPSISKLKERVGHRPVEILWGAILGVMTTVILVGLVGMF